jgi:hypothetical protein
MAQDDGFDPEGTGFFHGKIIAWEAGVRGKGEKRNYPLIYTNLLE